MSARRNSSKNRGAIGCMYEVKMHHLNMDAVKAALLLLNEMRPNTVESN